MFVSDNSVKSVSRYFRERLTGNFSEREIRKMFQLCAEKRLNLSPSELLLSDSVRMSESDLLYFRSIVKRLLNNEPFQYIYGETEFYGLRIKTDNRVLIPRPETEELVDWIIQSPHENLTKVVDICSGSGCIALALKSKLFHTEVSGLDISKDALDLSLENASLNNLNVRFSQLNVLDEELPFENNSLDLVVSNPPYVTESEKLGMQEHVLSHEPHLALFVADDSPFIFYDRIAQRALKKLKKGGWLYFEINEKYGLGMVHLMEKNGYKNVDLKEDLQGKNRMIRGQKYY